MKKISLYLLVVLISLPVIFFSGCSVEASLRRESRKIEADMQGEWEVVSIQLSSKTDTWEAAAEELGTFQILECGDEEDDFYCPAIRTFPSGLTFEFGFQLRARDDDDSLAEIAMFKGTAPSNEITWIGVFSLISLDDESMTWYSDGPAAISRDAETILIQAVRVN